MTPRAQSPGRFDVAAAAVLALVCLLVYSGALHVGFVLDDWPDIVDNPADHWTSVSLDAVLRTLAATDDRRPVAHLSFGLNHALGGPGPFGFHLVNVLIHLVNGWLVYAFACTIFRRERALDGQAGRRLDPALIRPAALFAALLFVVHPLQTQSVTYVVQRMTSLATGFYLASLLCFLRGRDADRAGRRRLWWAGAWACGLLSVGTKEVGFTLPLAIALVEWFFVDDLGRGWLRRRALPLAVYALAAVVVAVLALHSAGWARFEFTPFERVLTQTRVAVLYLSLILAPLPSRLNLLHEIDTSTSPIAPITTLLCSMFLALLLLLALRFARRRRLFSFAVLWFFLGLAIESSALPLRMIFEHRTYLPMVGVALLAAHILFTAVAPRWRVALAALVIGLLAAGTVVRNQVWRDPLRLWTETVAASPGDPLGHLRLGTLLAEAGRLDEGRAELETALRLDPDSARANDFLGTLSRAEGDLETALAYYRAAARLAPGDATARLHASDALVALGRLDEAAALLEQAVTLHSDERLLHALARVRERQGQDDAALALYARIAELAPGYTPARLDAGRLLARRGRLDDAIASFRAGLVAAAPGSPAAQGAAAVQTWIADAWWQAGRPDRAVAALEEALRLAPGWPMASLHLAWMIATGPEQAGGDPERAVSLASAVRAGQDAEQAEVLDVLAAGQAAAGRTKQALQLADRALELARAASDADLAGQIEARRARYADGQRVGGAPPLPGRLAPW